MEFSEAINRNHAVISVATVTPASQLPSSSSAYCATASSHDGSLEAEILGLRHQLNVLQQHGTRRALHLRWIDRALLIWLYRRCPHILHAITIVKPETVRACIRFAPDVAETPPVRSSCRAPGRASFHRRCP